MFRIICSALLTFVICGVGTAKAQSWKAGAAQANITPQSFMWMAGYAARTRPAEAKMTELWAKALALDDGSGKPAVLVTVDLVGIDRGLSTGIREELAKKYGLTSAQVAINCSHTHSGPVVARNLRPMHEYSLEPAQQELIHKYADFLHASVVEIVGKALAGLAPARLEWASGTTDFAVNRRNNKEAEVPMRREQGKIVGPSDHDVPVLAVKSADGKLLAVAFGYACHATVLDGYAWSGDYPGFAQIEVEKAHPECIALFWAGCGADQNPIPRRKIELAEKYGRMLGAAVNGILAGPLAPIAPKLATSYAEIPLVLAKLPTRDELVQQSTDKNKYQAMRARMLLEDIDAGRPLSQTYPYPVQLWRLGSEQSGGQVQWCFLGGEVVVDYAIRLKAELAGTKTWMAGYTNDVMAYIPSRRVLTEGGYEGGGAMVYYGMPTIWSEQVEASIVEEIHRQAK
ncbi:MAG: neutral/alkaline non-lysosomal ceramidase N-terminal domain-containing protein [Planctomycetaceae bacterium]|nr:neutral/alkaline non-lysosomal ceramidase N-terminal domain-containing protein [Planctomycetaceae bacterium]